MSKSSSSGKTITQFDRGSVSILNHFPTLNKPEIISLQLLFFALLEVLSLKSTENDPIKSRPIFQLLLHFLQSSKMIPVSMSLSAKSIRQLSLFQNYVKMLQTTLQTTLDAVQRPPPSSGGATITSILEKDYAKILLSNQTPSSLGIDIPQADFQLKVPMPLTTNDFDNIVVFRYVQDFYEVDKIGKGAFGLVFRAKNRLDNRMYAIKKIVFNENTDLTRRQAQRALREVRVLASLSHPNIVQYHCAWLELVPIEPTRTRRTSSQTKTPSLKIKQLDSVDELIHFEGQSSVQNKEEKSQRNSSSTSHEDDDEDGSEISVFQTNGKDSDIQINHQYHSDGDHPSSSCSKIDFHQSTSHYESSSNKQIIPLHTRNQIIHPKIQSNYINSKIVLFIQMQLCDTTLYDWLRRRDHTIIEETSDDKKTNFYSLNDLGQRRCWHIFKQLLTAVQYLHSQSFVHRDIKPRNIFLACDSKDPSSVHVKLGDFGLATLLDSELTTHSRELFKHDDSSGVGTALYAPPEQLNSKHCIATTKSDSYSLGIVLFELFNVFSTEMERVEYLSDLRVQLKVGERFTENYPFEANIIEQLVSIEGDKRLSVEELLTIYTKENQQRNRRQQNNTKQRLIEQLEEKLRDRDERIQQLELELEKNKLDVLCD